MTCKVSAPACKRAPPSRPVVHFPYLVHRGYAACPLRSNFNWHRSRPVSRICSHDERQGEAMRKYECQYSMPRNSAITYAINTVPTNSLRAHSDSDAAPRHEGMVLCGLNLVVLMATRAVAAAAL